MTLIRRGVIVAFPECQSLDVVGPAEVFASAGAYEVEVVAPDPEPFFMSNGMRVLPAAGIDDVRGSIDTLVIAGGGGTRRAATDERVVEWVRRAAKRSRRITSVCTGAFVLAQAGPPPRRGAAPPPAGGGTLAPAPPPPPPWRGAGFFPGGAGFTPPRGARR